MTTTIEERLDDAAPAVVAHDEHVRDAVAAMVAATRATEPRRRAWWRRRRWVIGAAAVVLAFGSATGALASTGIWVTPYLHHPDRTFTLDLGNGWRCTEIEEIYPRDGIAGKPPVPLDDPTIIGARAIMQRLAVTRADADAARADLTTNDMIDASQTEADQQWSVFSWAVSTKFDAAMRSAGLDGTRIMVAGSGQCVSAR